MKGVGAGGDYTAGRDRSGTRSSVQNYTFAHVSLKSLFFFSSPSLLPARDIIRACLPTLVASGLRRECVERLIAPRPVRGRNVIWGDLGSGARDSSRSLGVLSARPGTKAVRPAVQVPTVPYSTPSSGGAIPQLPCSNLLILPLPPVPSFHAV